MDLEKLKQGSDLIFDDPNFDEKLSEDEILELQHLVTVTGGRIEIIKNYKNKLFKLKLNVKRNEPS